MRDRRTDLALEAHEMASKSPGRLTALPGVRAREAKRHGYAVTTVEILDERGEQALGKPAGRYVTVELGEYFQRQEGFFDRAVTVLGDELRSLLPKDVQSVLVAGLGNPGMTPDALGPQSVDSVLATRHLLRQSPELFGGFRAVAAVRAEVVGNTGVEAAEQVAALARELHPDAVLLIDALAARSLARLCRTVQLSDTGLIPGSGVGNHRMALNRQTLGVPVLSLGVPTVVDGRTLALDLLEEAGAWEGDLPTLREGVFVTPREIDAEVRELARLAGYGINAALQGLSPAETAALLG